MNVKHTEAKCQGSLLVGGLSCKGQGDPGGNAQNTTKLEDRPHQVLGANFEKRGGVTGNSKCSQDVKKTDLQKRGKKRRKA